jgi:DNA-binding NarL/FixJ family response regulator
MTYAILVADDHTIIRNGLRKILEDTEDMRVVAEAAHGAEVMDCVRTLELDLVILDMSMPGRNGLDLLKAIKTENPKLPVLIFSMHPEEQYAVRAIRSGASGYLSKESDGDLLIPALRRVIGGHLYVSPKTAELLATDSSPLSDTPTHTRLSDREFEVFSRIVQGRSMTDIAHELSLSIKTVSTHKSHIMEKMAMDSTVELVRYALKHGLMDDNGG